MTRHAAIALVFLALTVGMPAPGSAYTSSRAYPVLLVHGYDPDFSCAGYDVASTWYYVKSTLQSLGWTGGIVGLKYYWCDTNYDASVDSHGSHTVHYASQGHYDPPGSAPKSHTPNADIRHLAYHLAWYIYNNYTSVGTNIQLIGHSMGGLIIRTMLKEFAAGDPDYPSTLYVQDAVTWGTPHNGAGTNCSSWPGAHSFQEYQFCPGSSFIADLNTNLNPQASLGTDWTNIASEGDTLVTVSSALYMYPVHRVDYVNPAFSHTGFLTDNSLVDDATVYRSDGGGSPSQQVNQPHNIKWTDKALFLSSW